MPATNIDMIADFVNPILARVKAEYIRKQYQVETWSDHIDFLTQVAHKQGRLHTLGEPDLNTVAINVINDWQRGKLPFFVAPPREAGDGLDAEAASNNKNSNSSSSMKRPASSASEDDDDDDDNAEEEDEDISGLEMLNHNQVMEVVHILKIKFISLSHIYLKRVEWYNFMDLTCRNASLRGQLLYY